MQRDSGETFFFIIIIIIPWKNLFPPFPWSEPSAPSIDPTPWDPQEVRREHTDR